MPIPRHSSLGLELPGQSSAGHVWFWGYAALFAGFSLHLLPADAAMALASLAFLTAPVPVMPCLYFFSLPWMYVAKFDFGLTLSLVQSVMYLGKVFLARQSLAFSPFEFVLLLYLTGSGIFGFLQSHSTTEISFVFYFLIASHVRHLYFREADARRVFLRNMLFAILVSVGIATVYGLVNGTSHLRRIVGLGYSNQLSGTLGTTRFAMYLCLALLYPLYCVQGKRLKYALAALLSAGVIATISLSALVVLGILWAYYFLATGGKIRTLMLVLAAALAVGLGGALLWNRFSNVPLFRPVAMRIEFTLDKLKTGDLDTATSGRANLFDSYLDEYARANLSEQLFGRHSVRSGDFQFSHNSYVDMLNSLGLFGLVLILALQIQRVRDSLGYPEKDLLISLKICVLLTAASVSIFTAQFWQVFLYF
jgi:hypothetical protein